jgi:TRAP-type C4-dicarboxylate transport system permease small subunit
MDRLHGFIRWVCTKLAILGGVMLICSAVYTAAEVLARRFLALSLGGASEMAAYAFAISSAWAFSFSLLERAHIRIDALYQLASRPIRAFVDVVSVALLAVYAGMLAYFSYRLLEFAVVHHTKANTPLQTPIWIPLSLWYAGLILFLLVATFLTVRVTLALLRGDYAWVDRHAGLASNEAQIEAPDLVAAAERSLEAERTKEKAATT